MTVLLAVIAGQLFVITWKLSAIHDELVARREAQR